MELITLDVPVERDSSGFWSNPAIPKMDGEDHDEWNNWMKSQGLQIRHSFLEQEDCEHPSYKKYFDEGDPDCSEWNPSLPEPEDWHTFFICDTEDGPVWVWARRISIEKQGKEK